METSEQSESRPSESVEHTSVENSAHGSVAELKERVIEHLKTVYDPEIPMNIYDLGLIYDVTIDKEMKAHILMTLTAPGCPAAGYLPVEVGEAAKRTPGISDAAVVLTFDPPWNMSMMPEYVKLELGLM